MIFLAAARPKTSLTRLRSPPSRLRREKLILDGQLDRCSERIKDGDPVIRNRTCALLLQAIRAVVFAGLTIGLTAAIQAQKLQPSPSPTPKTEGQEPVRVFTEEVRLPVV